MKTESIIAGLNPKGKAVMTLARIRDCEEFTEEELLLVAELSEYDTLTATDILNEVTNRPKHRIEQLAKNIRTTLAESLRKAADVIQ